MGKALISTLDKQRYLEILQAKGLSAALTALHHDKEAAEIATFEGSQGYQREMWDNLAAFRQISLELWDLAMDVDRASAPHQNSTGN